MRRLLIPAVCAALLQAQPPPQPPSAWPPDGVYRVEAVDTRPVILKMIQPAYPPNAMRARIEGLVHAACVVKADGTVGDVRITKSLDSQYGVDDAAIAALKQWVFSPGLKDGKAVAVAIVVELSFTAADTPRSISWPDGFAPLSDPPDTSQWLADVSEAGGLRIEIRYPSGWTLRKNPDDRSLFVLRKTGTLTTLSVLRPEKVEYSLDRPLTPVELEREAGGMAQRAGSSGLEMQPLGFGQAQAASRLWAWHAFKTSTVVTPDLDAKIAPIADKMFEGIRAWMFEATAGGQSISVNCVAIVPRSGSDEDKAALVGKQASQFGQILRAMSITVVR